MPFANNKVVYHNYQLRKARQKFGNQVYSTLIMLLSWATGYISSGNFSPPYVISCKVHEVVGDAWLIILLPMKTRTVSNDNTIHLRPKLRHQSSAKPHSTDKCNTYPLIKLALIKIQYIIM